MTPVPDLRRQIQHLSISDPFKNLGTLAPASSARGVDRRANRSSKFRRSEEVKKIDRNYVVQCLLCQNVPWATAAILNQLEGHHGSLSIQKYSSNVVEKCLKHVQEVHRDKIISELINNPQLHQISQDQFGNYVIQTALKESKDISLQLSAVVEPSQSEQGTCTSSIVSDLESSVSTLYDLYLQHFDL